MGGRSDNAAPCANVGEWCWDWYDAAYYGSSPAADPRGPSSGSSRVFRGGGWSDPASESPVEEHIAGTAGTVTRFYSIREIPKRYFKPVRE